MAGLGLIATGLALPNFLKAKKEYEAAQKAFNIEKAALIFEINRYNSEKYKDLEEYNQKALNPDTGLPYSANDPIANVKIVPLLNVLKVSFGILPIPDQYFQRAIVYIDNQSNREITIHEVGGSMYCYGDLAAKLGDITRKVDFKIAPNSITELSLTYKNTELGQDLVKFNNTIVGKDYANKVFNAIKNAGGKPGTIIQSSPKMYMGKDVSPCTMDLELTYSDSRDKNVRRALYKRAQGSIVYVG